MEYLGFCFMHMIVTARCFWFASSPSAHRNDEGGSQQALRLLSEATGQQALRLLSEATGQQALRFVRKGVVSEYGFCGLGGSHHAHTLVIASRRRRRGNPERGQSEGKKRFNSQWNI